jgi:hypothetical protein
MANPVELVSIMIVLDYLVCKDSAKTGNPLASFFLRHIAKDFIHGR